MIDPGLTGKVVLVTGANNPLGIGAATARAFGRQGAAVFVHYRRRSVPAGTGGDPTVSGEARWRAMQSETPDALLADIRDAGGRAEAWECDLADPANIPILFDRVEATFGNVDVLVNNAAHSEPDSLRPPERIGPDDRAPGGFRLAGLTATSHDQHFALNSRAVALMIAEFARRHVARGATWGRIVNVSTDGASAFPGEASYGASKHAMESYSRAAAVELGRDGITVNVVAPGPIQTGYIPPELEQRVVSGTPLGRVGEPADVADVIVSSPRSRPAGSPASCCTSAAGT